MGDDEKECGIVQSKPLHPKHSVEVLAKLDQALLQREKIGERFLHDMFPAKVFRAIPVRLNSENCPPGMSLTDAQRGRSKLKHYKEKKPRPKTQTIKMLVAGNHIIGGKSKKNVKERQTTRARSEPCSTGIEKTEERVRRERVELL
eukprot:TRINITY_DN421_c0_g2_i1.p1 TRINITY_DN421_c0_g2~~TRINITY_DN421_c0_g2_i1.p1  ORF type:complete len:146 (+),score=31.45 TRINITY_DN421_c0_g2_i1:472-909(+)